MWTCIEEPETNKINKGNFGKTQGEEGRGKINWRSATKWVENDGMVLKVWRLIKFYKDGGRREPCTIVSQSEVKCKWSAVDMLWILCQLNPSLTQLSWHMCRKHDTIISLSFCTSVDGHESFIKFGMIIFLNFLLMKTIKHLSVNPSMTRQFKNSLPEYNKCVHRGTIWKIHCKSIENEIIVYIEV